MSAKILVIGSGGREHAIVRKLTQSAHSTEIFCWPGSDAIARYATLPAAKNLPDLTKWVHTTGIDLTLVGDENYLARGITDSLKTDNSTCWAPTTDAARLETSKWWAKKFMRRHDIPHADGEYADSAAKAHEIISNFNRNFVLKFDGLAGGKGVQIDSRANPVLSFLDDVFYKKKWGDGGIIVEERLTGTEVSIFAAVNNTDYQLLPPARDYKSITKNNRTYNTGGMGAVAGWGILCEKTLAEIDKKIIQPTVEGLTAEKLTYRGFLYFGLMLTPTGARVLEYNCRLGDPETQAILPLIDGDLAHWLLSAATGKLPPIADLKISADYSTSVVLASENYPLKNSADSIVSGLDNVEKNPQVYIDHAGTKTVDSNWYTDGGRILTITSRAKTVAQARDKAYGTINAGLGFANAFYRHDIGAEF